MAIPHKQRLERWFCWPIFVGWLTLKWGINSRSYTCFKRLNMQLFLVWSLKTIRLHKVNALFRPLFYFPVTPQVSCFSQMCGRVAQVKELNCGTGSVFIVTLQIAPVKEKKDWQRIFFKLDMRGLTIRSHIYCHRQLLLLSLNKLFVGCHPECVNSGSVGTRTKASDGMAGMLSMDFMGVSCRGHQMV